MASELEARNLGLDAARRTSILPRITVSTSNAGPFTANSVPPLHGRRFVVTGANSGIGLDAARMFALKGARVILACRSVDKGERARAEILAASPDAHVEVRALDLSSLASVQRFAEDYLAKDQRLDVLVNNAGVMALPRSLTADGFEMQFGTNHLGHFALTAKLLPALLAGEKPRVVSVSSAVHRQGKINFDDLHGERSYAKWTAYTQSKLANLLFTLELDRRIRAANVPMLAVACHPGYAATNLQFVGPKMEKSSFVEGVMRLGNSLLGQVPAMGALPTVYAAVAEGVQSNDFIGPDGMMELRGHPKKVQPAKHARDAEVAARLWAVSEELCRLRFELSAR